MVRSAPKTGGARTVWRVIQGVRGVVTHRRKNVRYLLGGERFELQPLLLVLFDQRLLMPPELAFVPSAAAPGFVRRPIGDRTCHDRRRSAPGDPRRSLRARRRRCRELPILPDLGRWCSRRGSCHSPSGLIDLHSHAGSLYLDCPQPGHAVHGAVRAFGDRLASETPCRIAQATPHRSRYARDKGIRSGGGGMLDRRRLLGDSRSRTTRQRWVLFGFFLAAALAAPALAQPEPRVIRMGSGAAVASAADRGPTAADSGHPGPVTRVSFQDLWDTATGRTWEQEVQYLEPPAGITAGEQLLVEVYAVDRNGRPLSNALVEMTWNLGGEPHKVSGRTNPFGRMTSRRLIPLRCEGERCVVAVRVSRGQLERLAYSAFVPE